MDFVIFKQCDLKNRAYVIDLKGNKLFYGTVYQCRKFIDFMREGSENNAEGKIITRQLPSSGRNDRR